YPRLVEYVETLRREIERPASPPPGKFVITGKIDGHLLVLKAQFEFATTKPATLVRLACTQGQATGVTLDGKTPQLQGGGKPKAERPKTEDESDSGFAVTVEKPGEHALTLELVLPLATRPGGQGFVLDLPRAALSRLQLDLPAGARDVRSGGKALTATLLRLKGTQLKGSLGPVDKLDLSWRSPRDAATSAVLTADGVIAVKLAKQLTTKAVITL